MLLVERALADTRSRAQALVLAGKVRVGEGDAARRDRKPGDLVEATIPLVVETPEPYVSRGGHKLAAALDAFAIDPSGRTALDVGASTGGFTDVLLQRGARHVYAVDVGRGQLADALRRDPRVTSMERTNARTLTAETFPERIELVSIDVSFISLDRVLGPVATTLAPRADVVALVKPQFEAGKGRTDHGVVRDPAIHREVLERVVAASAAAGLGLARRHRVADPRAGGQSRVPAAPRPRPGLRGDRRSDRRAHPAGGRPAVTINRIGFAYNPTIEAAVELSARGSGWCRRARASPTGRPRPATSTPSCASCRRPTCSSSSAGTARSCERPGPSPRSTSRCSGSTSARSASCRRPRPAISRRSSERIVAGDFTIDERMAIEGRILRGGGVGDSERHLALNDIVIARGSLARVCRLDVSIDDTHLATFIADGLVVASPTGSTGYSFSAGGPILDPASRNLVVTPIAAYLSAIRSVVVSPQQVVRCRVVDAHEALVSVDGREDLPIAVGDVVEVHAVERPIRLIEPKGAQPFWDLLRHKVALLPS